MTTSRSRDTFYNYQQNKTISQEISENSVVYTWLGTTSSESINTERQEKYYENANLNPDSSRQDYSSLYTWLAGESDQESVVGTNIYTQNSSTLQSISYHMESLQDVYIESDSSIDTYPHNTILYTSIDTVYTLTFNSDNQNSIVKCKVSTHKDFTPAVVINEGVTYNLACLLKAGHFSDFKH